MRIRSSGTVGIGTSGYDSAQLSINSGSLDYVLYGESTDAGCVASFRDNSSTTNMEFGAIGNNHVFRKDTTEKMRLDSAGNLILNATAKTHHSSYTAIQGANFTLTNDNAGGASKSTTWTYNAYTDAGNDWTFMNSDEASMIQNTAIVEELALPPVKIHCSVLAEDAIKAAINDYRKKQEGLYT